MHTAENVQEVTGSEEKDDLVRACMTGADSTGEAFSKLFTLYQPFLLRFVMKRFHIQQTDAEDVVQETFILAQRKFGSLRSVEAFSTWMHQIAIHQVINKSRTRSSGDTSLDEFQASCIVSRQPKPEARMMQEELAEAVRSAVAALKPEFRQAVEDIEFHEMTYDETARLRNVPCGTVKTRRMRGMDQLHTSKKLRALFEQSC